MKHHHTHKPRPTLRRRWTLAAMVAARRGRIDYSVRRCTVRISELTIDLTDNLPDWHPESNTYRGP